MRLGCFGFSRDLAAIRRVGFDFAELDLMELSRMTDAEFAEFSRRAADSGLGFDSVCGFMPLTERIHSPEFPEAAWLEHARRMADRTASLGAKIWPLGVGKCRSIPDGADAQAARARVLSFFTGIARAIGPSGITLCVEPLGPANSNFLNTIAETVAFVGEMGLPNATSMCDMRHMVKLGEPFSEIERFIGGIGHAHIDYPLGDERRFPSDGDGYDYAPYLATLKRAGYAGRLSVEALHYDDLERESARSVELLRRLTR